jgi:hypothetical protein
LFQVPDGLLKDLNLVSSEPEQLVAVMTQDTTYLTGLVAVVDTRLIKLDAANVTTTVLGLENLCVFFNGQAMDL